MNLQKDKVSKQTLAFIIFVYFARIILSPLVLATFILHKLCMRLCPKIALCAVSTGGTGGHIFPAIRFIAKAKSKNHNIYFVTNSLSKHILYKIGAYSKGIFQYNEDGQAHSVNIPLQFLPITPVSLKSIQCLVRFALSMAMAFIFILRKCVVLETIVGFGGYASFPVVFFGVVFYKKIYIHEQNTTFGVVNELFLPFAIKAFTAFPVGHPTPNCHYTGMPLSTKLESRQITHNTLARRSTVSNSVNILIISGSNGGAEAIQSIVPAIILLSKKYRHAMHVHHQVHHSLMDAVRTKYKEHNIPATVSTFFDNIYEILPTINLCISRSGASSITDLLSFGITTIFVPLRNSARNHQVKNASWVLQNNVGFLYKPWESNVYSFVALITFCLLESTRLEISVRAQSIVKRNARSVICNTIWG